MIKSSLQSYFKLEIIAWPHGYVKHDGKIAVKVLPSVSFMWWSGALLVIKEALRGRLCFPRELEI